MGKLNPVLPSETKPIIVMAPPSPAGATLSGHDLANGLCRPTGVTLQPVGCKDDLIALNHRDDTGPRQVREANRDKNDWPD